MITLLRDWWEEVPRPVWMDIYQGMQPAIQARMPVSIARYLSNEAANYQRAYGPQQPVAKDADQ